MPYAFCHLVTPQNSRENKMRFSLRMNPRQTICLHAHQRQEMSDSISFCIWGRGIILNVNDGNFLIWLLRTEGFFILANVDILKISLYPVSVSAIWRRKPARQEMKAYDKYLLCLWHHTGRVNDEEQMRRSERWRPIPSHFASPSKAPWRLNDASGLSQVARSCK